MWGDLELPDVPDSTCRHCGVPIRWRYESDDGNGIWRHIDSRGYSLGQQCSLWATPVEAPAIPG